ncbi:hypothetical protein GGR50DRAFT_691904 [Xylaria sp. CBS 124048]|nr:hypothetical protein GGR50DRAFT_691904 [Xylaria sp. CBS 124048]
MVGGQQRTAEDSRDDYIRQHSREQALALFNWGQQRRQEQRQQQQQQQKQQKQQERQRHTRQLPSHWLPVANEQRTLVLSNYIHTIHTIHNNLNIPVTFHFAVSICCTLIILTNTLTPLSTSIVSSPNIVPAQPPTSAAIGCDTFPHLTFAIGFLPVPVPVPVPVPSTGRARGNDQHHFLSHAPSSATPATSNAIIVFNSIPCLPHTEELVSPNSETSSSTPASPGFGFGFGLDRGTAPTAPAAPAAHQFHAAQPLSCFSSATHEPDSLAAVSLLDDLDRTLVLGIIEGGRLERTATN